MDIGKIYKITNTINNMAYIGKTQNSIEYRFGQHCRPSSNCKRLSRAIQKYGKDSFKIEEICSVIDLIDLNSLEILLIKEHNTLSPDGYNLTIGGEGTKGIDRSDLKKPLLRICKKTKQIKEYPSLKSVELDGFNERSVRQAICNNQGIFTCKGYYWVYKSNFNKFTEHIYKGNSIGVVQYVISTKEIIVHKSLQNLQDNHFSPNEIKNSCKERLCYRNSLWFYENEFSDVLLSQKLELIKNPHKVLNLKESVKGFYLHKKTGTYNAKIKYNGISVSLGYFKTELEARNAYLNELNIKSNAYLSGEL